MKRFAVKDRVVPNIEETLSALAVSTTKSETPSSSVEARGWKSAVMRSEVELPRSFRFRFMLVARFL